MKLKEVFSILEQGSKDYVQVLKTDQGKLDLFFTSIVIATIIEVLI